MRFVKMVSSVGSFLTAVLPQTNGRQDSSVGLERQLYEGYQKFKGAVLQEGGSKAYLISLARAQRREGKWVEAAATFESAGELYSAMFCLHTAMGVGQGRMSDHFLKISQLYHRVGRHERGERYKRYGFDQREVENIKTAMRFCKDCKKKVTVKEVKKQMEDNLTDDHEKFVTSLKEYVDNRA